jgi:hypothetical protein
MKDGVNNLAQVISKHATKLHKFVTKMPFEDDTMV